MSENPGGTPPRDDDPAKPAEPVVPETPAEPPAAPDPVEKAAPVPPAPEPEPAPPAAPPAPEPAPPAVPPAPPAPPVAPPAPPVAPPAPPAPPSYGQPPAGAYPPPPPSGYGQPPAGAYPPPPAPGYGQPPAGGYPPQGSPYGQPAPGAYPPAAPVYGQAPPGAYPPPAGGYGPPVQASPIGESFSYGWRKFTSHGGLFIGAALVWFVVAAVVFTVVALIFGGFASLFDPNGRGMGSGMGIGLSFGLIVFYAAVALIGYLIQAAFIRAALTVTEGRELSFGDFFKFVDAGPIVLTALLLTAIGVVLNLIPFFGGLVSLVVNFLLLFTFWFVIDKHLTPVDAIKASYQLITANLSTTILFYLLSLVILFAGAILCGIGLLVAVPVVLVATAFLFKRLLGDPIAA
ncbi:hypothetical protein [Cellulomonas sp. P5_E12]